jgi:hypothetical protein
VEDPVTYKAVPIVKLDNYKLIFNGISKKIRISKYRTVKELRNMAAAAFDLTQSSELNIRAFWSNQPADVLPLDEPICAYSVLSNITFLLEHQISSQSNSSTTNTALTL